VKPPKRALNKTTGNVFVFADWMASTLSRRKRSFTKENLQGFFGKFQNIQMKK
jgi:hypothetical protein